MSRFDIAGARPLRVAVELIGSGHHPAAAALSTTRPIDGDDLWVDLTARTDRHGAPNLEFEQSTVVRIQAPDLRIAQQKTASIHSEAVKDGRNPNGTSVMVDIEVMIAPDERTARKELARLDSLLEGPRTPTSLLYVGTPSGLAGLIADIHAVHVADGVTLLPLSLPDVLGHIAFETLPWLETVGLNLSSEQVNIIRRCGLRQCATGGGAQDEFQSRLA